MIQLMERDQYSDSKFALEGKIRQLETRLNDQRREYIEIVRMALRGERLGSKWK